MKNQLWSSIHELFQEVEQLREKAKSMAFKGKGSMRRIERGVQPEDIIELRAGIRSKLDLLQSHLAQNLTEREVYLVVFPVVIYFDEMVQSSIIQAKPIEWPLLQKELFQLDNGGEKFYETLDDILRKPDTLPFVYEVFYFCLSDGFQGKFTGNMVKINEYKNKVRAKIPISSGASEEEAANTPNLMRFGKLPLWSYVATGVFVAGVYIALSTLARSYVN